MSTPSKQTLGPYELVAPVGAGGMGEVFRARDTRLNRDVAIKVLPKDFANDPDRLRRFEQETKTLASINHPNILTIHDVGMQDGAPYLVCELLEGQTLRQDMNGAALPLRKAIDYALKIAQGLAAAHSKGIIHRDLKPENIFITKDGRAKILDFGLAKLQEPPHSAFCTPHSPANSELSTLVESTEPGKVMGTPAYMSPEQVRGEPADHRSDIFAFGCVLYEMLTGSRAFKRDTAIQSMNAVLSEEPLDLTHSESKVPARIERLLRRCLEKSPENRFQSTKDLAFALEDTTPEVGSRGTARTGTWIRVELALLGGVLFGIVWLALRARPAAVSAPATWVEMTPPNQRFDVYPAPAVSPDGRQIAFFAPTPDDTNQSGLWVRSLDSPVARLLPGTTSGDLSGVPASWSPDGRSLAFFAESKLKRIDLSGGTPLTLAGAANPRGCAWGSHGVIIFVPAASIKAVYRISASGSDAIPLKLARPLDGYLAWPHFLPDGEHFLISTDTNGEFIVSLDGKEIRRLGGTPLRSRVEFAGGYLFFGREGSLFAQRFNPRALAVSDAPFRIAEGLGFSSGDTHDYAFSVSPAGTLAYWSGPAQPVTQLTWFSREGRRLGAVGQPCECIGFDISPDEQEAVLELHDPRFNEIGLWLMEAASGVESKFSLNGGPGLWSAACPVWSHRDNRIYFSTFPGLAAQSLNAHAPESVFDQMGWLEDISPDGKYALVSQATSDAGQHTCLLSLKETKAIRPYLTSGHMTIAGRFSPDGHWVAYFGDESGRYEVYVQSFPEPGRPVPISRNGGQSPEWRQDGKELYFLSLDGRLMAAAVDGTQPLFRVTDLKPLFPVNVEDDAPRRQVFPSKDGQRFLVNTQVETATAPRLKIVLNWKRLLPKQ